MFAARGSSRTTVGPGSSCRRQPQGSALLATLTGASVAIIVAVTTSFVVVALDTTDQARPAPTTPAGSTPAPSKAPAAAPPVRPATAALTPAADAAVRSLRAGLYCQDLRNGSFSYAAAFQYWRLHGNPVQMDADRNGIPCETVYSTAAVNAFWYQ